MNSVELELTSLDENKNVTTEALNQANLSVYKKVY